MMREPAHTLITSPSPGWPSPVTSRMDDRARGTEGWGTSPEGSDVDAWVRLRRAAGW